MSHTDIKIEQVNGNIRHLDESLQLGAKIIQHLEHGKYVYRPDSEGRYTVRVPGSSPFVVQVTKRAIEQYGFKVIDEGMK